MMFSKSSICVITLATMLFTESHAETLRASSRTLSLELIAGYEPASVVTDHNALDLDQKAMEDQLDTFSQVGFDNALRIYREGGHSKSYAVVTLNSPLTQTIALESEITGFDAEGRAVTGEAYKEGEIDATTLSFRYAVSASQESHSKCHVGGLQATNVVGCLTSNGTLTAGSAITYSYTVASDNKNGRTLQGFSIGADKKMRTDEILTNPYFADFQKFFDYYGTANYTDDIVTAAFQKQSVTLNGKSFDWSAYDFEPRAEVVAKASAFMGVAMYTIRELEDAIDDCNAGDAKRNADSVQALDEAVAFYTGSLEGTDGSGSGVFIHSLAEKRCVDFKTCGTTGDETVGNAKVNIDIFAYFSKMQDNLAKKDCAAARLDKEAIAKKLFIPMIQGTIRYAYKQTQPDTNAKGEAEGAIFAAAVLPIVAKCNADAAATIHEEMKPNSGNIANLEKVKEAFESTYECMGISCADVGGVYDSKNAKYYDGTAPCGSSKSKTGLAVGLSIGGVALVVILALVFMRRGKSSPEFKSSGSTQV